MKKREYGEITVANSIGERIRLIRELYGYTQRTFADKLGIQQPYLSRLERSENFPSKTLRLLMTELFHIRLQWLETGEGGKYSDEVICQTQVLEQMVEARDALWDMVDSLDEDLFQKFGIVRKGQRK